MPQVRTHMIRKYILMTLLGTAALSQALAQDSLKTKRKQYDALLPAWCLDINLKGGLLMQDLTQVDMKGNYTNALAATNIGKVKFDNGMAYGFDAQLGYFFGKNRHWGVGVGFMYMAQSGDMTLDQFHVEYQSVDGRNDIFRQHITANGPIKESLKMTNINIPVVLKYKNQFGKHWGFTMDAGILYNMQLKNSYTTNASFDYEAIYAYQKAEGGLVAYYDNHSVNNLDAVDVIWLKDYWTSKNPGGSFADTMAKWRAQGYNVGVGMKPASNTGDASYKTGSIGLLLKPSVSYLVNPHVALDFGLYYTYQTFKSDMSNYRLTDKVGSYTSLTNGMSSVTSSSLGLNIGARIYFGKAKDTDGDGIPDKRDLCPDVKGLEQFGGCPDTDGDGIPDKEDECPTVKGLAQFHGCPDTDGDGIADKDDACPTVKGLAQFQGCPDTDGDGIPDKDDACPTVKGLAQYHGCPDTDGDGIPDNEDKCPNEAGPASNNGCPLPPPPPPVEKTEDEVKVKMPILFDLNKTTIRKSSYPALQDAVQNLKDDKDAIVIINGYADATGKATYNKVLSAKRAAVVKAYLLKHGVRAKRIKIKGNGAKSPVADNKTKEGRAQNRRVEISIK